MPRTIQHSLLHVELRADDSLSVITYTHIQSITVTLKRHETRVVEICILLEDVRNRHLET